MSEHAEQALVVAWARVNEARWPELALLFAVPNAAKRGKAVAAMMKREGLVAGVPDMVLPVARAAFHGLFIEMKQQRLVRRGDGFKMERTYPTQVQREWHARLRAQGYAMAVCWSAEEAEDVLERYLRGTYQETAA